LTDAKSFIVLIIQFPPAHVTGHMTTRRRPDVARGLDFCTTVLQEL